MRKSSKGHLRRPHVYCQYCIFFQLEKLIYLDYFCIYACMFFFFFSWKHFWDRIILVVLFCHHLCWTVSGFCEDNKSFVLEIYVWEVPKCPHMFDIQKPKNTSSLLPWKNPIWSIMRVRVGGLLTWFSVQKVLSCLMREQAIKFHLYFLFSKWIIIEEERLML